MKRGERKENGEGSENINKSEDKVKYLDPKADPTFKRVFGEHPELVLSFLNALLPFESKDEEIEWLEYLPPELVPENPLGKDSIVDVRCRDKKGRLFIVEMQMMWTSAYKQRVLFNASKAYVSQLKKGMHYKLLQPVYSLNLLNDTYSDSKEYYHDYRIVEMAGTGEVIEGLRLIFIELPKFTAKSYSDRKMQVLWLRYLTEIDEETQKVPEELMVNPEISLAVSELEESAYSQNQLMGYDRFWDMVSTQRTYIYDAMEKGLMMGQKEGMEKGLKKGLKEGLEKGRTEGRLEGRLEGMKESVRRMREKGFSDGDIAGILGLSLKELM